MIKVEQQLAGLDLQVMMIAIFSKMQIFDEFMYVIEMRTKNSIESKKEITKKSPNKFALKTGME